MKPTVTTYNLFAGNGRHIRKATKVIFPDGKEIRFLERVGKKLAIREALRHREEARE